MNKKVSLLVLHGLVVGLLSAWQLPHCLSCIFFLEGLCHPCQEKSLCAWNQTERQCRTLFFCFLTQDPLRRNSLFNLPLIFFTFFWSAQESADVRVGTGEDERRGELHWVGQIIMGIREITGTKGCDFSQDCPLPFAAFHLSCMVKVASSLIYIGTYYFLPFIASFIFTSFHPLIQF